MRLLLTNDDGVHADGILTLKQALEPFGELTVVAPERPRSGAGHAITLHKPLRLSTTKLADGSPANACSGTPADCVTVGTLEVMDGEVDLVVAGINHGPNLGWDVHYSGTVAAAKEAVMIGKRAIAFSLASFARDVHWETAAEAVRRLMPWLIAHPTPPLTLLNINVPNVPVAEIKGICVTRQGPRQYVDRLEKRVDPAGRPYYWLGGTVAGHETAADTDVSAIANGFISVTPLQLDLTAHTLLPNLTELTRL